MKYFFTSTIFLPMLNLFFKLSPHCKKYRRMGIRNFGQYITVHLFHFFPTCSSMIQHGTKSFKNCSSVGSFSIGWNLQKKSSAVWDCHGLWFLLLLWHWLSVGSSVNICSSMVFHELQRNFCSRDGATPPPLSSLNLMLFLSHFPHPFLSQMVYILFLPLTKYFITEVPQTRLTGSVWAVPDPFWSCLKLVLSDI